MVAAVRAGEIFARDQRQWQRYLGKARRARRSGPAEGVKGKMNLERQVMALAATHPEYVIFEGAAPA